MGHVIIDQLFRVKKGGGREELLDELVCGLSLTFIHEQVRILPARYRVTVEKLTEAEADMLIRQDRRRREKE